MPSPKTVTVTMEIVNDDGSKTIVQTAELDGSRLPQNRYARATDAPERIVIGMVDPFRDDSDLYQRRDYFVDSFRRIALPPPETHFNLDLQLPPVKSSGVVYTITEIEAPDKRVVLALRHGKPEIQTLTEGEAAGFAALYPEMHLFFLDIP